MQETDAYYFIFTFTSLSSFIKIHHLKIKQMPTQQIMLAFRPNGLPTHDNFKMVSIDLPEIKDGELLLKGMYYSVDPYMRGRMNDAKSYTPPFEVNKPISGGVIAKVTKSLSDQFKEGDVVIGNFPWQQEFIANEKEAKKIDTNLAPASYYLGILGMPGLTAYFGLMHIGKPKSGETVVVSGGSWCGWNRGGTNC